MAADLGLVDPDLRDRVLMLMDACRNRGIDMRSNVGLRDPLEQARLWRQSRSIEEINAKAQAFAAGGAPFLQLCLLSVGPQHGDHVTNAPPGYSWHQYGRAVDCFWLVSGQTEWSTRKLVNGQNGYKVYADEAEALGLIAGGHWKSLKDWPHVQLDQAGDPSSSLTMQQIDSKMRERFGALIAN